MFKARIRTGSGLIGRINRERSKRNWHVLCDDQYVEFSEGTLQDVLTKHCKWTVTDMTGNGLYFTTKYVPSQLRTFR